MMAAALSTLIRNDSVKPGVLALFLFRKGDRLRVVPMSLLTGIVVFAAAYSPGLGPLTLTALSPSF